MSHLPHIDPIWLDHVPGIAVGVVTPNTMELQFNGCKAWEPERETLTSDTLYDLASLTKVVFTTTVILQLIEEGRLALTTRIQSILPEYIHPETTVGDLLTHQSGLPADDPAYKQCRDAAALRHFVLSHSLTYTPRTQVVYTDFGFLILGWVIESIEGPLDEVLNRRIKQRLGLRDLCFRPNDPQRCAPTERTTHRGLIRGSVHDGKAYLMGGIAGNAGCFSTLSDLCRFAQSFLDEKYSLLSKTTFDLLRQTHTQGLDHVRTLGWYRHDPSCAFGHLISEDCLFHTGFSGTSIAIDFERQVAVVILTNRVHPLRDNPFIQPIRNSLHDAVFSQFPETCE